MEMLKFEIVGEKGRQIRLYVLIIVVVSLLSLVLYENLQASCCGDELVSIILASLIFIILFACLFVMPNIPYRRCKKMGHVEFTASEIIIHNEDDIKVFKVKDLSSIKVRLLGFDGQNQLINSRLKWKTDFLPNPIPQNGLGNHIAFKVGHVLFAYEFYVNNIVDYNCLKDAVQNWSKINKVLNRTIKR